jgi:hypothetical protein
MSYRLCRRIGSLSHSHDGIADLGSRAAREHPVHTGPGL